MLALGQAATETELVRVLPRWAAVIQASRRVIFVDSYPTTATRKIRRVELGQMAVTAFTGSGVTVSGGADPAPGTGDLRRQVSHESALAQRDRS
ncbi:MAG: hypothetical protein ACLPUO_00140 [Streptosporangiaceae bacterium]|jgi:hypothetical protein